jgi:hypothetical protein
MAYSFAAISAADLAYLAADKPILGSQSIPTLTATSTTAWWHNSGGVTDRTDASYPARRAYDGFPCFVTKPTTASADKTWYYSMQLGVLATFDFVAIIGHNFGTLHAGGALTITLEVDDASNFATCVSIPITVTTGTSNARIMVLSLFHTAAAALRYSSVAYARLKITRGATNFTPEIGELYLGKRLQLFHKPNVPYDSYAKTSDIETAKTLGGVIHNTVYARGRRVLGAEWTEENTTLQAAIDSFVSGTNYKTTPFVWIENPYSAPASWHMMVADDANHALPLEDNPAKRTFELTASEQGAEAYYLAKGTY